MIIIIHPWESDKKGHLVLPAATDGRGVARDGQVTWTQQSWLYDNIY